MKGFGLRGKGGTGGPLAGQLGGTLCPFDFLTGSKGDPYLSSTDHSHDADMTDTANPALTRQIIGLAMRAHTRIGPGLLESACERCLCREPSKNG
jgi:hypothetical protein